MSDESRDLDGPPLATGIVQSLVTRWGLFRHYWVLAKLVITVVATGLLLLHARAVAFRASVAAETSLSGADFHRVRIQLVADATLASAALIVTTALAVYKPRGMARYAWRKQRAENESRPELRPLG